jgi:hypothetical protein
MICTSGLQVSFLRHKMDKPALQLVQRLTDAFLMGLKAVAYIFLLV